MQLYQQKKIAPKAKGRKPMNFDPLLQDLRSKLGPDWGFYHEFLEEAKRAVALQEDVSAWFEQIEQLVKGRDELWFSHQGVLFLLGEMGVKVRSEAHRINNMPPPPLPPPSPTNKMQRDYATKRMPIDFNRSLPPTPSSATFTSQPITPNVAFFGEEYTPINKPVALVNGADPLFFTDPSFQRDVQHFFGASIPRNGTQHTGEHATTYYKHPELAPPYNAGDDDLNVWKKRIEDESDLNNSGTHDDVEKVAHRRYEKVLR